MRWYRDCRIELDRFLDVLYENELSRLIIEGDPPEDVLKDAWREIYLEFCELTQQGTYNELFEKTKRLQEMNGRICFLDGAVIHLQDLCYDPQLIKWVNECGIALILDQDEEPIKKLKVVQGRIKRMIMDMRNLEKEIDELQNQQKSSGGIEYYDDWLMIMSKTFGYAVRSKDITVSQFVRNQKRINEQALKQQADGNRKD